jgi:nucleoside-diphosphate-sugar epimerase
MGGSRPRTFLVTGAGGCVGARVVEQLLARGDRVVATDRRGAAFPTAPAGAASGALTAIPGDLTDRTLSPRLVAGVDAVIHTAAVVDISLPLAALRPINVDAVESLYDAAATAGAKVFVHFGTGSVYGPQPRPIREDDPLLVRNDYGVSKVLSEELLRARAGRGPVANILRPSLIYGPRGRVLLNLFAALPPLVREVTTRVPRIVGGPKANFVHADDVAGAAIHLADHPQEHGAVFNVANDEPTPFGLVITETLAAAGLRVGGPSVPLAPAVWLLRATRPLIDREPVFALLNRVVGCAWAYERRRYGLSEEFRPSIPREMLDFLADDVVFANEKLKATGYALRHPDFLPTWRETLGWFRENGWTPAALAPVPAAGSRAA